MAKGANFGFNRSRRNHVLPGVILTGNTLAFTFPKTLTQEQKTARATTIYHQVSTLIHPIERSKPPACAHSLSKSATLEQAEPAARAELTQLDRPLNAPVPRERSSMPFFFAQRPQAEANC